jgi:hypothetical protein
MSHGLGGIGERVVERIGGTFVQRWVRSPVPIGIGSATGVADGETEMRELEMDGRLVLEDGSVSRGRRSAGEGREREKSFSTPG